MTEFYWGVVSYLSIGLTLAEGIRWAKAKWGLDPLGAKALALVFFAWPVIILIALVMVWRKR